MKKFKFLRYLELLLTWLFFTCYQLAFSQQWPEITRQTKPWTRWWWMGSSVNPTDLSIALEQYHKVGLGGLEITPIYGVKGYEDKFINYLSPEWMKMLTYTLQEAERLDLGIDMATGTGWPFGGPWVSPNEASKNFIFKTYILKSGERLRETISCRQEPLVRAIGRQVNISELVEPLGENENLQAMALEQVRFEKMLPLEALMAYSNDGKILNLTNKVSKKGELDWIAPAGNWTLYAVFQGWHGKIVERAAPGGEGEVIDHFSREAIENYLRKFNKVFAGYDVHSIRAYFNDSYEVDDARGQANYTPNLFAEFLKRRGYDLRQYLPVLLGNDLNERSIRVRCDYRETISDLLLDEFTRPWQNWAKKNGAIVRNQAHGSPGNILDLYAASDIPETEGTDLFTIKFASSAAHITGKQLASAEAATWLDEHFVTSLADVKQAVDRFFLGGVNHIVYHGTPYSPQDDPWPGWLFYASVHFGPTNSFWNDFAALNNYVTRCQSFLQAGQPDNDILLYFPFHDYISQTTPEMLVHFRSSRLPGDSVFAFQSVAQQMIDQGYTLDYISDAQLKHLACVNNSLQINGISYKTIVLPACRMIPVAAFRKLVDLAKAGATILVYQTLPIDVPGFGQLDERRKSFQRLIRQLHFNTIENSKISEAIIRKGKFSMGSNFIELLARAGIKKDLKSEKGLRVICRKYADGLVYFVKNWGKEAVDDWMPFQTEAKSVAIFNPMNESVGFANFRDSKIGGIEVYLQLEPGETCILRTHHQIVEGISCQYLKMFEGTKQIDGIWDISFLTGGPELPSAMTTDTLISWTEFPGAAYKAFSGTAKYAISFQKPAGKADAWVLNLGRVAESAQIRLNGEDLGTRFAPPFKWTISTDQIQEMNILEIYTSNLMSNRIANLERLGINYKKFYNVNFPSRKRENRGADGLFTAIKWPPRESGLIGPVTLTPVMLINPR